jgi:hypothetical protein
VTGKKSRSFKFLENELLEKIEENDFWSFAERYIIKRRKLFKVMKVDQLMTFSQKLNHPLTKLAKSLEKNAFQTFKSTHPSMTFLTFSPRHSKFFPRAFFHQAPC